jgi:hypothetical protein
VFHYSFHINVDGWPFACRSKDSDDRWANRVCPSCPNWTKLMNRMGYWHFDKETCLVSEVLIAFPMMIMMMMMMMMMMMLTIMKTIL